MKSADEIVRALQNYASDCGADEACFQCTVAWMCDELGGNAPKIIANTVERLQSKLAAYEDTGLSPDEIPRWIAVGERLPDPKDMKHIQVFVIQKSTITGRPNIMSVARWNGTDWVRRGVEIARVTHWAYLPQPPKDGAK